MGTQLKLGADFDGAAYEPELDKVRLTGQLKKIFEIMRDGQWHTLRSLEIMTGFPQASISASIRCFRKKKFGGFIVDRERIGKTGQFQYKLDITGANVEVILVDGKPRKIKELYYLWNGEYHGNHLVFWRTGSAGYTANIQEAGTYTKEEANNIIQNSSGKFIKAIPKSYIDDAGNKARKIVIDSQYVDTTKILIHIS